MRIVFTVTMRILWGAYLLLTSCYCLLAFLPYTYYALIKAPCYWWMPWFVQHHAAVYWLALAAAAVGYWPRRSRLRFAAFGLFVATGIALTVHPVMPAITNDRAAWWWAMAALVPMVALAAADLASHLQNPHHQVASEGPMLGYSTISVVAAAGAILSGLGVYGHVYWQTRKWVLGARDFELIVWSVATHIAVAVLAVSLLNLLRIIARKTPRPRTFHIAFLLSLSGVVLWLTFRHFFDSALSFDGGLANAYAGFLALTLTVFGFSVLLPFIERARPGTEVTDPRWSRTFTISAAIGFSLLMLASPVLVSGGDWNGVLHHILVLLLWAGMIACAYRLIPAHRRYAAVTVVAVAVLTAASYSALHASAIWWAQPLGATDDDIARSMNQYAARDASFELAHSLLISRRSESCGELCRVLRQHANIRNVRLASDIGLVEQLTPTQSARPNIFIVVVDSLRPDYLGGYNPQVDFTPNVDALARDSIVLHNAYTQYAGTTLSEPAIWSGMMLLHAHYLQPFSRINSLEKLAHVDGYQLVVSYDTVLKELLNDRADIVKLDADKPLWNEFEMCSTVRQLTNVLSARREPAMPVMFYAQPMNVHQFARNNVSPLQQSRWRLRNGFNNRIALEVNTVDACMGQFTGYLKAHKLYDNSIIVVTSDHGDATGEFGRSSHSVLIYPEIMRVPLIVHLPPALRKQVVYDDSRVSLLTDIAPSLYYLLGHRPILNHPLFGRPLFAHTKAELESFQRDSVLLASDVRAVFGILDQNGRFLYATYDSPAESFLFDLKSDPNAQHSILNPALKQHYDQLLIQQLQSVADLYGYKPSLGSLLAAR